MIGANPVRMGLPEVYGGLQTRMIDTVPVSALGAVALQWYTRLKYMAKDNIGIVVGGALLTKEKFDELSEHDQRVLIETSEIAGKANDKLVRRTDDQAYDALVKRGMIVVDTSVHQGRMGRRCKEGARESRRTRVQQELARSSRKGRRQLGHHLAHLAELRDHIVGQNRGLLADGRSNRE